MTAILSRSTRQKRPAGHVEEKYKMMTTGRGLKMLGDLPVVHGACGIDDTIAVGSLAMATEQTDMRLSGKTRGALGEPAFPGYF